VAQLITCYCTQEWTWKLQLGKARDLGHSRESEGRKDRRDCGKTTFLLWKMVESYIKRACRKVTELMEVRERKP
jgi:hypothetical protein